MFFLQMFCMLGGTMREEMIWSSCWSLRVAMDCMRAQVILLKSSLYYIFYGTQKLSTVINQFLYLV